MSEQDLKTPDDVLEELYRECLNDADAYGCGWLESAVTMYDAELIAELREYYQRVYA